MKLVVASNNENKVKEIKQILQGKFDKVFSLSELGVQIDVVEDGQTLFENALKKAKAISEATQMTALADDTGLIVESLNGRPGVRTARYAGENATADDNNAKLLKEMQGKTCRDAKFQTAMVLYYPNGSYICGIGEVFGKITTEKVGQNGFGYDSVFFSDDLQKTFAQCTNEQKNAVSHRFKAISNLLEQL